MYIQSITLSHLRTFAAKTTIEFTIPGSCGGTNSKDLDNVTIVLGNNGSGKSTLLKAIGLATIAPILPSSGYVPFSMVRRTSGKTAEKNAQIDATLEMGNHDTNPPLPDSERIQSTTVGIQRINDLERVFTQGQSGHESIWDLMTDHDSPAFLAVGYGASRRTESPENYDRGVRKRHALRFLRLQGLFEEDFTLIPLARWLPELERSRPNHHSEVIELVDRLLPHPFRFRGQYMDGEYWFEQGAFKVPFSALSDGYRAYLGWVSDLLFHLSTGYPKSERLANASGIVMVDEIDLHLHPAWQMEVVPALARTFPKLQFIFTTHSPIVTGSVPSDRIVRLELAGSKSKVAKIQTNVHGLNAEQILVSEFFGLESTRASGLRKKLSKLNQRALDGDSEATLEVLRYLAQGEEAATKG